MGAGLAKDIRSLYPAHYNDYMVSPLMLGDLVLTHISNNFGIIGIVAQNGYGRDKSTVYTQYKDFEVCLRKISNLHAKATGVKYYMPFGIGCGLANGDWGQSF